MHPPEAHAAAPRSIGDFLRSYAMIVLSIVTALALERAAVAWQNAEAARASRARIEAELALNVAELRQSLTNNRAAVDNAREVAKGLIAQLKAPSIDTKAVMELFGRGFSKRVVTIPTWRRDAWEAAIADQSATHLAPRDLRRYAEIYTNARDLVDVEHVTFGPELQQTAADLQLSLRLGAPDTKLAAAVMLRFLISSQQIIMAEQSLLDTATKG